MTIPCPFGSPDSAARSPSTPSGVMRVVSRTVPPFSRFPMPHLTAFSTSGCTVSAGSMKSVVPISITTCSSAPKRSYSKNRYVLM